MGDIIQSNIIEDINHTKGNLSPRSRHPRPGGEAGQLDDEAARSPGGCRARKHFPESARSSAGASSGVRGHRSLVRQLRGTVAGV